MRLVTSAIPDSSKLVRFLPGAGPEYDRMIVVAEEDQGETLYLKGWIGNPTITGYPHQWAAHTSFAYNVGLGTYGKSSVARLFAQGRQVEACRFLGRYVYAGGRRLQGLANRRAAEIALCLKDAE